MTNTDKIWNPLSILLCLLVSVVLKKKKMKRWCKDILLKVSPWRRFTLPVFGERRHWFKHVRREGIFRGEVPIWFNESSFSLNQMSSHISAPSMMSNALIYLLHFEPTAGSGNMVRTPLERGHHGNEVALVTEHHFSPNPGNWSFPAHFIFSTGGSFPRSLHA